MTNVTRSDFQVWQITGNGNRLLFIEIDDDDEDMDL